MIGKISAPRGERVEPLTRYLFGPGRHNEHTDPHVVAGWRDPDELEPPVRPDGSRDLRRLNGLLRQPHDAMGNFGLARPVWHCSLRTAPGDRLLSDEEWAAIVRDVMDRTGLAPHGQDDDAVRWVAVRHADDHVHVVAMLARQDGRRPSVRNDRYRVRDACQAAERRYGLRATAPADRTAARCPSRAETEKAARRGLPEPPRVTLRRAVTTAAAGAGSETEFFTRLQADGVTVRPRYSARNPGQVTGYSVALPGDTGKDGSPVWYAGKQLAPDLTWPKLSRRWHPDEPQPAHSLNPAERGNLYEQAARAAGEAAARIRGCARTNPALAADAARAASDTLHAAAAALDSPPLREAADFFDRAAREPYGRVPAPTRTGNQLRQTARLMTALAYRGGHRPSAAFVMVVQLIALAEAVAELREAQHRAHQAAAARTAARRIRAATAAPPAQTPVPPAARTAADLAAMSFPDQSALSRTRQSPRGHAARPSPAPGQPRRRGPAP